MTTLSCTLNDADLSSRRDRWIALGSRALVAVEATSRGLRLDFAAESGVGAELVELAEQERDCCPFATWTVLQGDDRVVLDVSGKSDEAVPAVQGMFVPLRNLLKGRAATASAPR